MPQNRTCLIEGCAGRYRARGYCSKHYIQARKDGTLLPPMPPRRVEGAPYPDCEWHPAPRPNATDTELAWAAGLFEGEGCIHQGMDRGHRMRCFVINMTDEDVLRRFQSIVGVGRVYRIKPNRTTLAHYKPQFGWRVGSWPELLMLAEVFGPWLGTRRMARWNELLASPPRHPRAPRLTHCRNGHPMDGPDADVYVVTRHGQLHRECRVCRRERRSA